MSKFLLEIYFQILHKQIGSKDVWLLESVLNLYKTATGKNDISCEEIRDKFLEINTEKEIVQKGENNEIV